MEKKNLSMEIYFCILENCNVFYYNKLHYYNNKNSIYIRKRMSKGNIYYN